jgi:hypothetical protein
VGNIGHPKQVNYSGNYTYAGGGSKSEDRTLLKAADIKYDLRKRTKGP